MQAKIELGFRGRCEDCNESSFFGSWKAAHEWVQAHNKANHKENR